MSLTVARLVKHMSEIGVYTVGNKGYFSSLSVAFGWLAAQAAPTLISSAGTIAVTRYQDKITGTGTLFITDKVRAGDLLHVLNDVQSTGYTSHYYPILNVIDDTHLIIETGIWGNTNSARSYEIVRPAKYAFNLLSGEHNTAGLVVPDGFDLVLSGNGRATELVGSSTVQADNQAPQLGVPAYGHLSLQNLVSTHGLLKGAANTAAYPHIGESQCSVRLLNIAIKQAPIIPPQNAGFDIGSQCLQFASAGLRIKNLEVEGHFDHGVILSGTDLLLVDGLTVTSYQGWENVVIGCGQQQASKDKYINNMVLRRIGDVSAFAGISQLRCNPNSTGTQRRIRFNFNNFHIYSDNPNNAGMTGVDCLTGQSTGNGIELNFTNGIIDGNGTRGADMSINGTAMTVNLKNVAHADGSPITINSASTAVYVCRNSGSTVDLAYAAAITPDAGRARVQNIGALTGAITLNAPVNSIKGDSVTFNFVESATPSAITFNAVFKGVAGNTIAAGTNGQKLSIAFSFDGTDWLLNGTVPAWM